MQDREPRSGPPMSLSTVFRVCLGVAMGVFGAIVAVPAAAVAQIISRELLALRRERIDAGPRRGP